jgi:hypothetical protein
MPRETDSAEHDEADHVDTPRPGHADTGSAAGVGGVTGAAFGALAGPIGAALGAIGGILTGAAAERAMHANDDTKTEDKKTEEERADE